MMDIKDLEKLGLKRNEAKIFEELLKYVETTAGNLIKKTGFHRNIIYDNLEKLLDKGLAKFTIKDKVRYYSVFSSEAIVEIIKKKEDEIQQQYKIARKISKEIKRNIKIRETTSETCILQGIEGIRELMKDTLKAGKDHIVYGAPETSLRIMGEYFWENYTLKRREKKIKVKMIFNNELKSFSRIIMDKLTEIRYLPKQFDNLTETTVYGNKVAITVWAEKPITTLIHDERIANAYRKYFELLWKIAKK